MSENHVQQDNHSSEGANYVQPSDVEAPLYDDEDGIDWDQIMADSEEDERLGVKPAFSTADYPDYETAMEALRERIHGICERAVHRARTTEHSVDVTR